MEPAREKGVEVVLDFAADVPHNVMVDPLRFRQIVTNLLTNALKFTSEGRITISFQEDRRKRSTGDDIFNLMISVSDTGMGIASDKLNTVFERFKQAGDASGGLFGGTGLGLAICKQLIEQMGGTIRVESMPGEGSTFWIYMPLHLAQRIEAGRTLSGKWALLVMPAGPDRHGYHRLRGGDFYCDFASDARIALKQVATAARIGAPYDVVVVDDSIEDVTATTFAQAIRAQPSTAQTRIVLLAKRSALMDAAEEGLFNTIINKPAGAATLPTALRQIGSDLATSAAPSAAVSANSKEKAGPTTSDSSSAPRFEGTRVLIAEDDEVNRLFACNLLDELGCSYSIATTGREALAALGRETFDIVLLDCMMPDMDGYTAAAHIRQMQEGGEIDFVPVIAVTANAMAKDRQKCLNSGMDDYLAKPVREEDLVGSSGVGSASGSPAHRSLRRCRRR